ncbi:hypothetical protein FJW05_11780 [Mesorhizobium sp. B2-9-1]|uniref:hypothetical protein n=1 Tax=unclassified Mesorhizobium TaxID=325217 RepID=UPI001126E949|nr:MULTISPECIES: hypothetical protein [unclassified Mesorhizobium]TPI47630.1 hypothetical protein FJW05_11780 [Mesorhizobium sp. B2-9-1]TPJ21642.1 hypothetical protein FJ425_24655 [Mesorhizobium sp. B2-7-2]
MAAFRLSAIGLLASAFAFTAVAADNAKAAPATAIAAPAQDLRKLCRQVKNDDTVRPYSHALHAGTVKAFNKLFPQAKSAPQESELTTQANYRCMNGKLLACFVGANLPCAKMNAARDNPGADEFCRTNPNDDVVPAFATGHDAVYAYKCVGGKAVITGQPWALDKRGFAEKLWAVVPER